MPGKRVGWGNPTRTPSTYGNICLKDVGFTRLKLGSGMEVTEIPAFAGTRRRGEFRLYRSRPLNRAVDFCRQVDQAFGGQDAGDGADFIKHLIKDLGVGGGDL
jgi:hypothetical protein